MFCSALLKKAAGLLFNIQANVSEMKKMTHDSRYKKGRPKAAFCSGVRFNCTKTQVADQNNSAGQSMPGVPTQ